MVLRALHLCSGYGGFELGLRLAGIPTRTVAHVERDSYAAATLVARMADQALDRAPVWSDLATFDTRAWRGRVDLVTAGLPCQPFSAAGGQRGLDDGRHLWPMAERVIAGVGPRYVLLENVPNVVLPRYRWLEHVLSDLARLGFDAEWGVLAASDVGAPHKRRRFWLLAYTDDTRPEPKLGRLAERGETLADPARQRCIQGDGPRSRSRRGIEGAETRRDPRWPPARGDHDGWSEWIAAGGPEPALRRITHGPPRGLAEALHLGGNGLVPQVAAAALIELARRAGVQLAHDPTGGGCVSARRAPTFAADRIDEERTESRR